MSCGCTRRKEVTLKNVGGMEHEEPASPAPEPVLKTLPTDQCIACCQKHMDEAWCMFHEYGYSLENRRFIRGNLRAIVLHSYKEWTGIATLARECALLVQEAEDDKAEEKMRELCELIDEEFYRVNPEVKERLEALEREKKA